MKRTGVTEEGKKAVDLAKEKREKREMCRELNIIEKKTQGE